MVGLKMFGKGNQFRKVRMGNRMLHRNQMMDTNFAAMHYQPSYIGYENVDENIGNEWQQYNGRFPNQNYIHNPFMYDGHSGLHQNQFMQNPNGVNSGLHDYNTNFSNPYDNHFHDPSYHANQYQNFGNEQIQPNYFENEHYNSHANFIGNPLIQNEHEVKPQNHIPNQSQFNQNQYLGYQGGKSVKKPGAIKSVMDQFKSDNGSIDFNKMVGTTSQLASAINQVSGLVKGVSGMFKVGV